MKKPLLNESRIRYWLTSFKSGNVDDEDYQRRVIDTLVNSVYVYDDEDGGKRIVLTFNLSGNNTATLTSSDIECYAPPLNANPNPALCGERFSFKQKDTPCRKWQGVSSFCLFWGSTLHRKSSTLQWGQPSSPVNPLALAHRSAPSIMVS